MTHATSRTMSRAAGPLTRLVESKRRELDLLRESLDDSSADSLPPIAEVLDELADLPVLCSRLEQLHVARTAASTVAVADLMEELAQRVHRLGQVAAALRELNNDCDDESGAGTALNARLSNMAARLFQLAARLEPGEAEDDLPLGRRPVSLSRSRADLQVGLGQLMSSLRGEISDLLTPRVYLPAQSGDPLDATGVVLQSLSASLVLAICAWAATFLPPAVHSGPFVQSA